VESSSTALTCPTTLTYSTPWHKTFARLALSSVRKKASDAPFAGCECASEAVRLTRKTAHASGVVVKQRVTFVASESRKASSTSIDALNASKHAAHKVPRFATLTGRGSSALDAVGKRASVLAIVY